MNPCVNFTGPMAWAQLSSGVCGTSCVPVFLRSPPGYNFFSTIECGLSHQVDTCGDATGRVFPTLAHLFFGGYKDLPVEPVWTGMDHRLAYTECAYADNSGNFPFAGHNCSLSAYVACYCAPTVPPTIPFATKVPTQTPTFAPTTEPPVDGGGGGGATTSTPTFAPTTEPPVDGGGGATTSTPTFAPTTEPPVDGGGAATSVPTEPPVDGLIAPTSSPTATALSPLGLPFLDDGALQQFRELSWNVSCLPEACSVCFPCADNGTHAYVDKIVVNSERLEGPYPDIDRFHALSYVDMKGNNFTTGAACLSYATCSRGAQCMFDDPLCSSPVVLYGAFAVLGLGALGAAGVFYRRKKAKTAPPVLLQHHLGPSGAFEYVTPVGLKDDPRYRGALVVKELRFADDI